MRFSTIIIVPTLCLATLSIQAYPTATSLNDGLSLTYDPVEDASLLSWWGITDRFYFVEQSEDLVKWSFMPVFEVGADDVIEWGFRANAPKMFLRLLHTADTDAGLMAMDFDEDGLTTFEEYELETDPFNPDTSGDGIFDGIAKKLGLPLLPPEEPAPDPADTTPPTITLISPASAVLVP